jgi:hypothetical protein
MAHTSAKRWADRGRDTGIEKQVSENSTNLRDALITAEEAYQQLQELFAFVGSTVQLLADQLFKEEIADRGDSVANAEEVAKTQDAMDAVTAGHELYEAANNIAVAQSDRLSELRRMI